MTSATLAAGRRRTVSPLVVSALAVMAAVLVGTAMAVNPRIGIALLVAACAVPSCSSTSRSELRCGRCSLGSGTSSRSGSPDFRRAPRPCLLDRRAARRASSSSPAPRAPRRIGSPAPARLACTLARLGRGRRRGGRRALALGVVRRRRPGSSHITSLSSGHPSRHRRLRAGNRALRGGRPGARRSRRRAPRRDIDEH